MTYMWANDIYIYDVGDDHGESVSISWPFDGHSKKS